MKYKSLFSRTLTLSAIVFLLSFPLLAQDGGVGIGTTNPQATLHIKGTSFPGGSGTRTLLDENFDSYTVEQESDMQGVGCFTEGWEVDPILEVPGTYVCDNCRDNMLHINSNSPGFPRNCSQDATAIVRFASTPTETTIAISYDFRLQVYQTPDRLWVYLHNETTDQQVAVLATYQGSAQSRVDGRYSETQTVVPGNDYSIRFHYKAMDGWGATIDNVLVTEEAETAPASFVFRLEDGSEGVGRVLTAGDDKGNASWKPLGSPRPSNDSSTLSENSSRGNNENQDQVILDLQATINDQEAVFESQSKKIQTLEEKLLP
ncbi:hypothetical protein EI546_13905 [Aequorivita sp. H23M31]|uniref:Uncharacterized protein n=1 Tax=Aequorivita ciconiae TaxID=2494375 RepID=A0A410G643_9FLAO|nr:hypothetical protein [Aequorivita sp. H23M31]QAA82746.1 hypothetical protein EI546_13905 [Aequorivita sp. H23M31]